MNLLGLGLRSGFKYSLSWMRQAKPAAYASKMGGREIIDLRSQLFRGAAQEAVEEKIDEIRDRSFRERLGLLKQDNK